MSRRRRCTSALADDRMPRSGAGGTAAAASNALPPSLSAAAAVAAWSASAASEAAAEDGSSPAKRTRGDLHRERLGWHLRLWGAVPCRAPCDAGPLCCCRPIKRSLAHFLPTRTNIDSRWSVGLKAHATAAHHGCGRRHEQQVEGDADACRSRRGGSRQRMRPVVWQSLQPSVHGPDCMC